MLYLLNIIVLSILSFLTLSFFPNLKIFGVVPFFPLYFVIALAYFRKGFEPLALAALAGILFDIFSPYPFGFYLAIFLLAVGIVRFMYQEGMRSLTFGSYLLVSIVVSAVYFGSQVANLYFSKAVLGFGIFWSALAFLGVNFVCVILVYAFSTWYFDLLERLNNYLKRR